MPATIINIKAVEDSTERVLKQISEQESALSEIDRIVNSMEGVWQSGAQEVYADSFRQVKQRIEDFNRSMNESVENMRGFVDECISVDELTAREIRNVSW